MKRLTQREIARLLATRATPEPPAGLAHRIKAEIPGSIQVDRRTFQPGRRWLMPPLVEGLHPSWLAAASILLVTGVGMVAARIPAQPDDVWKWMALSGVVHIDDIVVTAPAPTEPQGVAVAMAQPRASRGTRAAVQPRQKMLSAAGNAEKADEPGLVAKDASKSLFAPEPGRVAIVATPPTGGLDMRVSDERKALPGTTTPAARAEAPEAGVAMPRTTMEVDASTAGGMQALSSAVPPTAANRQSRARAKGTIGEEENAVTVVVLDEAGQPCEGVTVTLKRLSQGGMWTRFATTDADGAATFRGVPLATYRALAAAPSIAPAQMVLAVASERIPTRAELRVRTLPRH